MLEPSIQYTDIDNIRGSVMDYIIELTSLRDMSYTTNLIELHIINSLNLIQLILFIESTFGVKIKMFTIQLEDFESIDKLSSFIKRKIDNKKNI